MDRTQTIFTRTAAKEKSDDSKAFTPGEFMELLENPALEDGWLIEESMKTGNVDCMLAAYRRRLQSFMHEVETSEERWDEVSDLVTICTLARVIENETIIAEKRRRLQVLLEDDNLKRNFDGVWRSIENDAGRIVDRIAAATKL